MRIYYVCNRCGYINEEGQEAELEAELEFDLTSITDSDIALDVECGECGNLQTLIVHVMLEDNAKDNEEE